MEAIFVCICLSLKSKSVTQRDNIHPCTMSWPSVWYVKCINITLTEKITTCLVVKPPDNETGCKAKSYNKHVLKAMAPFLRHVEVYRTIQEVFG